MSQNNICWISIAKIKATSCIKSMLRDVSHDAEMFFSMKTSLIHLKKKSCIQTVRLVIHNLMMSKMRQRSVLPTTTESSEDVRSVGAAYEDTNMQEVRSLGPTTQRKAPEIFHPEECFISESLTADNKEPQSMKEAWNGKNSDK